MKNLESELMYAALVIIYRGLLVMPVVVMWNCGQR